MKRRGYRILPALAVLLAVLAGCGEKPAPIVEPTPTPAPSAAPAPSEFALVCYPDSSFHPLTGDNRTNLSLGGLLYEGLFALDSHFQPQPVLCREFTMSEDACVWSFTLRAQAAFSDGSPLSAQTAAACLNQARTSPLYAGRLSDVSTVRAEGERVVITLRAPNGNLPALLDVPICLGEGQRPLGTGPYRLSEEGDGLFLQARSDWWQGGTPPRDKIPLHPLRTADEMIQAFDTRLASLVSTDLTASNALGFSGSFETTDYPTSVMLFLGFNLRQGPCQDAVVRQALQRAADREAIVAGALSRHAQSAALPAAPGSPLYHEDLARELSFDLSAAAAVLEGGGWRTGEDGVLERGRERLELKLVISSGSAARSAVGELLAADLQRLGAAVTVCRLDWDDYLSALAQGEFDLYLGEVRMTADFNPAALLRPEGALNYGGYQDEEAQALLKAFQAASGQARSLAAKTLYRRLAEEPPLVALGFKNWSLLTQWRQISGLTPTQQNIFYQFADWTIVE